MLKDFAFVYTTNQAEMQLFYNTIELVKVGAHVSYVATSLWSAFDIYLYNLVFSHF